MTTSPGIRVLDVPKDASQRDLKVYFSNPRNGGSKILKIYYPLQGNDAVILFDDGKANPMIFQQRHVLRGRDVKVRSLQRQVFSKVTVELASEFTVLLDNDPKYLDDIQYDGELEVTSEDNYTISGDWYQIEWAWQYLDDVCNRPDSTQAVSIGNGVENHLEDSLRQTENENRASEENQNEFPVLYPHHRTMRGASGFQPDFYEDFENQSEYSQFLDTLVKSDTNYTDHFRFPDATGLDFLAKGIGSDDELPWKPRNFNKRKPQTGFTVSHEDFQDLPLTFDFNISTLNVAILMSDLLKEKADAIVSSASGDLSAQYGLSRVIARAAGTKLKEECREYINRHGPLCIGDVIHTSAGGGLNAKVGFVIHAVGPSWRETRSEESTHLLTCTYLNILQYASSHMWLQTISMPLIGTGGVGFPLDVCVQALYDALLIFVIEEENIRHLQHVRLVCNDEDSTCATIVVLRSLLDIDQIATQEAAKDRYIKRSIQFDFKAKNVLLDVETESQTENDIQERESDPLDDEDEEKLVADTTSSLSSGNNDVILPDSECVEDERISLLTKDTTARFAKSSSTGNVIQPASVQNTMQERSDPKTFEDVPKKSLVKELTDSTSSEECIPFGMIDSDEEDALSKLEMESNLSIHKMKTEYNGNHEPSSNSRDQVFDSSNDNQSEIRRDETVDDALQASGQESGTLEPGKENFNLDSRNEVNQDKTVVGYCSMPETIESELQFKGDDHLHGGSKETEETKLDLEHKFTVETECVAETLFSDNPDRATHPEVLQSINYEELPIAEDKHKPIEQAIEDINNDNYEVHDDLDDIDRT